MDEVVATALFNKGVMQNIEGDTKSALETFDDIIRRFGEDKDPGVTALVTPSMPALIKDARAWRKALGK